MRTAENKGNGDVDADNIDRWTAVIGNSFRTVGIGLLTSGCPAE